MKIKILFLILSCLNVLVCTSYAATYHVKTNGDNTLAGTSWALAWKTLQKAANTMSAGDEVFIADGTYDIFTITSNGTSAAPIYYRGTNAPVIDGNHIGPATIGIHINGNWNVITNVKIYDAIYGIYIVAQNIRIENCTIYGCKSGIYIVDTMSIIKNNKIIDNTWNFGGHGNGIDLYANGNFIINNLIRNNGNDGIGGPRPDNNYIAGNIISRNKTGISLWTSGAANRCDNNIIINNIIRSNSSRGIYIVGSNNEIGNNLIYRNSSYGIVFDGWPGAGVCSGNTVYQNIIYKNNNIGLYIGLVNPVVGSKVINNTFYKNNGGVYYYLDASSLYIYNNNVTASNTGYGVKKDGAAIAFQFRYNCTNDGTIGMPTGTSNIPDDPKFLSTIDDSEDFHLRWSSALIGAGKPNTVANCIGRYTAYGYSSLPVYNVTTNFTVRFTTDRRNGTIPGNAWIKILFQGPDTFTLGGALYNSTTSSWGGAPGTITVSAVAGQEITLQRTGGFNTTAGQTEEIIFSGIGNPATPGTNYTVTITTYSNNGSLIEQIEANYFKIYKDSGFQISKDISEVSYNSNPISLPIPGSTLHYELTLSVISNEKAFYSILYDRIPLYTEYSAGSAKSTNGWTVQWSTNTSPGFSYTSSDWEGAEPAVDKIKWVRWIKQYVDPDEDNKKFCFKVVIK